MEWEEKNGGYEPAGNYSGYRINPHHDEYSNRTVFSAWWNLKNLGDFLHLSDAKECIVDHIRSRQEAS
jgi:hypothetical protein